MDRAVHLREARRPDIESGRLLNVGGGGMLLAGRSALAVGAVIDVGMAAGLRGRPPHLFRVRVVRVEKKKLRQPRWWAATRTAYLYGCEVLAGLSPAGDAAAH